jgi:hypothetical protein
MRCAYQDVESVAEMATHSAEERLASLAHGQVADGAVHLEAGLAPRFQAGLQALRGPGTRVHGHPQPCQFLHDGAPATGPTQMLESLPACLPACLLACLPVRRMRETGMRRKLPQAASAARDERRLAVQVPSGSQSGRRRPAPRR